MSFRTRWLAAPVASLLLSVAPDPAAAGCTTTTDASAVKRSIGRQVRCNDKRLRKGPAATCTVSDPPACAGSLVTDAVALAYGPNDPATAGVDTHALRDQLNCQKRIGAGVSKYVGTKFRGSTSG